MASSATSISVRGTTRCPAPSAAEPGVAADVPDRGGDGSSANSPASDIDHDLDHAGPGRRHRTGSRVRGNTASPPSPLTMWTTTTGSSITAPGAMSTISGSTAKASLRRRKSPGSVTTEPRSVSPSGCSPARPRVRTSSPTDEAKVARTPLMVTTRPERAPRLATREWIRSEGRRSGIVGRQQRHAPAGWYRSRSRSIDPAVPPHLVLLGGERGRGERGGRRGPAPLQPGQPGEGGGGFGGEGGQSRDLSRSEARVTSLGAILPADPGSARPRPGRVGGRSRSCDPRPTLAP